METGSRTSWVDCNTHSCRFKGINYCKTHRNMSCTLCIILFHNDCDIKIKAEMEFIKCIIEIIDSLIYKLQKGGVDYNLNRTCLEYKECVDGIIKRNQELLDRYDINKINICNIDSCISEYRALLKYIFESQANHELIQYIQKVNSCFNLVDNLEEDDVLSLYGNKTQFFLDVKREELNFREKALKFIKDEIREGNLKLKEETKEKMKNDLEFLNNEIEKFAYEFDKERYKYEEIKIRLDNIENKCNINDNKLQSLNKIIEEQLLNNVKIKESIKANQNEFEDKYVQLIEKHEGFKNTIEKIKYDFNEKPREIDRIILPLSTNINNFNEEQK